MLCVHQTKFGFDEVRKLCQEAAYLEMDSREYAISRITCSDKKYYCQIPFTVCLVVDLRSERDVVHQLRDFIVSGEADDCWILTS